MVCGALAALLSLEEDMEIVAEASRGDEVIPTALDALPDVALLDIEMPAWRRRRLKRACPLAG